MQFFRSRFYENFFSGRVWLVLLILGGLTVSCSKEYDSNHIYSGVKIQIWEDLAQGPSKYAFSCQTLEMFNCLNYTIENKIKRSGNKFEIELLRVELGSDFCEIGDGPAMVKVSLGELNTGTYDVDFLFNGDKYQVQLSIDDAQVKVTPKKEYLSSEFVVIFPIIKRVPAHTLWGTVSAYKSSCIPLIDSFFVSLQELGTSNFAGADGNYGYFNVNNNLMNDVEQAGAVESRSFIRSFQGSAYHLQALEQKFIDSLSVNWFYFDGQTLSF